MALKGNKTDWKAFTVEIQKTAKQVRALIPTPLPLEPDIIAADTTQNAILAYHDLEKAAMRLNNVLTGLSGGTPFAGQQT
jgi:hypothetical protein